MISVALDSRALEPDYKAHLRRGTGRYTACLLAALDSAVSTYENCDIEIKRLSSSDFSPSVWQKRIVDSMPFGKQTASNQVVLPQRMREVDCDFFHFLNHTDAPARSSVASVVTVLDLIPLKFPDLYCASRSNLRFRLARYLENRAITSARGILAISENTKRDLQEILGVAAENVFVTPLGVNERFLLGQECMGDENYKSKMRAQFGIPRELAVLLYVGGIDPRKNVPFLIEVFSELVRIWPRREKPILLLCGDNKGDEHYAALSRQIDELGLSQFVRELGFVEDEKLPSLYGAADCFVFPSLYEGFGLPVLEAMACGVPVVCGNNSSMPEVVGDCGVLLGDNDLSSWSEGLCNCLLGEFDESLRQRARRRASDFSWHRTAELTLEAYREIACRLQQRSIAA